MPNVRLPRKGETISWRPKHQRLAPKKVQSIAPKAVAPKEKPQTLLEQYPDLIQSEPREEWWNAPVEEPNGLLDNLPDITKEPQKFQDLLTERLRRRND